MNVGTDFREHNKCTECHRYFENGSSPSQRICKPCLRKITIDRANEIEESDPDAPKSDIEYPGLDQVPFEGIAAIGAIFAEGEIKYGRDNWKKQPNNLTYNAERCRHALKHLFLWANGDRQEPHLAKVAWFCVTQIWREKNDVNS